MSNREITEEIETITTQRKPEVFPGSEWNNLEASPIYLLLLNSPVSAFPANPHRDYRAISAYAYPIVGNSIDYSRLSINDTQPETSSNECCVIDKTLGLNAEIIPAVMERSVCIEQTSRISSLHSREAVL